MTARIIQTHAAILGLVLTLALGCVGDSVVDSDDESTNNTSGSENDSGTGSETDAGSVADMSGSTEIDRATPVANLAAEEVETLCNEYRVESDTILPPQETLRFNCTLTGIYTPAFDGSATTDEELREACVPIRDMCIDMGLQADDYICPIPEQTDCDATVTEIETCFREELQATADFFGTITCEEATLSQAGEMGPGEVDLPDSCATLYEECPGLE